MARAQKEAEALRLQQQESLRKAQADEAAKQERRERAKRNEVIWNSIRPGVLRTIETINLEVLNKDGIIKTYPTEVIDHAHYRSGWEGTGENMHMTTASWAVSHIWAGAALLFATKTPIADNNPKCGCLYVLVSNGDEVSVGFVDAYFETFHSAEKMGFDNLLSVAEHRDEGGGRVEISRFSFEQDLGKLLEVDEITGKIEQTTTRLVYEYLEKRGFPESQPIFRSTPMSTWIDRFLGS